MIRSLSVEYAIKECCEALGVCRSGYYQWKKAEPTQREQAEAELVEQIRRVFAANKGRYGSPRVSQALRQDGIECGENRVARLMRENELAARRKKAFRPRTTVPGSGAAPNLIKDLEPSGVDQIWVSDITYVATMEGWLYLAVILDLFSRKVVGWKLLRNIGSSTGRDSSGQRVNDARSRSGAVLSFGSRQPVQQSGRPQTLECDRR